MLYVILRCSERHVFLLPWQLSIQLRSFLQRYTILQCPSTQNGGNCLQGQDNRNTRYLVILVKIKVRLISANAGASNAVGNNTRRVRPPPWKTIEWDSSHPRTRATYNILDKYLGSLSPPSHCSQMLYILCQANRNFILNFL